ncbi:hypothetical protein [Roseobacter weihaiensis]|uniref:hypothetical protein n=1 Tax=Roseobacter weihaiensis TaxID=2763262 RepID=UPI001D09A1E5|nr:hypothetical protein [Roseobacter sp. H9]
MQHVPAKVTVVRPDGSEMHYSSAQLEDLPTYSLKTTTPWRQEPAMFEGILLKDLLEANGLGDVEAIKVTAENDYQVMIPRSIWQETDVLVATRVDGKPHSRRARGPIQFVIDMEGYKALEVASEDHLVWMVSKIEAAN